MTTVNHEVQFGEAAGGARASKGQAVGKGTFAKARENIHGVRKGVPGEKGVGVDLEGKAH
jgi:hypothetical protein